ncbi:hypothetical protein DYI37_03030 [Fulvimarina endophytica]|uniref:Uncharacterized protein n=1 Tax=Fulvimarina endophytica TaxID=2293836 RepID=A0A371XB65_9HYPH|nr:hypothetical protein [Fulvimarina endophytica]RFC66431.1 hypothetical protein DYI37_03030 [Fulvimarina endophytica]
MIVLRVIRGITDHFPIRATEWVMMLPTFGMAVAFHLSPNMFSVSPSFESLADWGSEAAWAAVVLACGVMRFAALVINGTFQGFRLSPHIRFAASLVGIAFWSQWTLCFIQAFIELGGAPSAIIAYGTFCCMELLNLYRSGTDIRPRGRGRRHG